MRNVRRKYTREIPTVVEEVPRTMAEMFDQFMLMKKGGGLASRTIEGYYENYDYFSKYAGNDVLSSDMTTELFVGWVQYMREDCDYAIHTINIRVRSMRSFVRYCYEDKQWLREPIHKRFMPIKAPQDVVDAFTVEEVRALVGACDIRTYTGFRTKTVLYLLIDTMARASELVEIKRANVDLKLRHILLEADNTKLRQARYLPISPKTAKLLAEYMAETADFNSKYLVLTYEGERISTSTLRGNISVLAKVAGVEHARTSPHTFRHTGALFYIMNGGDPFSLQKILGHSHMNMVRRYVQMTDRDVQSQHEEFSPLNYVFK